MSIEVGMCVRTKQPMYRAIIWGILQHEPWKQTPAGERFIVREIYSDGVLRLDAIDSAERDVEIHSQYVEEDAVE